MSARLLALPLFLVLTACEEPASTPSPTSVDETLTPDLERPRGQSIVDWHAEPPRAIDLLFVVDDTMSATNARSATIGDFGLLVSRLEDAGFDWRAGVISSNMADSTQTGRLRSAHGYEVIDGSVPEPSALFREMVEGDPDVYVEHASSGIGAAFIALQAQDSDVLLRPEAALAVIVVSDRDDATPSAVVSTQGMIDFLHTFRPEQTWTSFSTVGATKPGCGPLDAYCTVAMATGGLDMRPTMPLPDGDVAVLADVAVERAWTLTLTASPLPQTLRVTALDATGAGERLVEGEDWWFDLDRRAVQLTGPGGGRTGGLEVHYRTP